MKIAILTSYPLDVRYGSGVVRTLQGFAMAFRKQGHSCKIIHPHSASQDFSEFIRQRLRFNEQLAATRFDSFDLVIGSDFDGYALDRSGIADYVVFNGGLLADILRFEETETKILLQDLADKEMQNLRKANAVFVPSEYSARMISHYYNIPKDLIHIVPLGIDLKMWARFAQKARVKNRAQQSILCVARQYSRKGIPDLLHAFALLSKRRTGLRLDIVGGGLKLKANKDLARELQLSGTVHFHGDVTDQAELAAYYKNSALFCLPSYHETFGLVFTEAMAFGLPIVSYNTTAIPEIVHHKETGFLVQPGEINKLAARMDELLSDKNLAAWMGRNGYLKVKTMDWQKSVAVFLEKN